MGETKIQEPKSQRNKGDKVAARRNRQTTSPIRPLGALRIETNDLITRAV